MVCDVEIKAAQGEYAANRWCTICCAEVGGVIVTMRCAASEMNQSSYLILQPVNNVH